MKVLFATKNSAKLEYYGTKLKEKGIELVSLKDLNIDAEVEENGELPKDNAIIKATFYHNLTNIPTISIDDALYLENVPDNLQPATHVRRVNGKRLNDHEMIEHYKHLVSTYGLNGVLEGYYLKSVAIVTDTHTYTYDFKDKVHFLEKESKTIHKDYPLDSIHFIPELKKYVSELTSDELEATLGQNKKELFEYISKILFEIKEEN